MTERPILFSGAMVRAILAGKKTQTRRLVSGALHTAVSTFEPENCGLWQQVVAASAQFPVSYGPLVRCPYGGAGGRLWVREAFALPRALDSVRPGELPVIERDVPVWYRASDGEESLANRGRWRSSLHMPRWASRLTLDVEAVRVERLHAITEADAVGEGAPARDSFAALWDSINSTRAPWADNPYVWVVSFRRSEVCVMPSTWSEGRPSDRDPRDDPREGDELLEYDGSRRLLVDMVTDAHVYVRVTDGAGGLLSAVRVERGRWQAACLGFEPAPT